MTGDANRLAELAALYGVQTGYRGADGQRVRCSSEAILATLQALGVAVEGHRGVNAALRHRRRELWDRPLDLALVAWDGSLEEIRIRAPARELGGPYGATLVLEDGTERAWHTTNVSVGGTAQLDGAEYVELVSRGPAPPVPLGYHRLHVRVGRRKGSSLVIAAPRRAPQPEGRTWGVFLPLYALFTERSWGVGDLSDLAELAQWTGALGGRWVATLPLMAAFHEEALFDPSPYSPASRLFWNELYLDVTAVPELERSAQARSLIGSARFQRDLARVRAGGLVDHREAMSLKRRVLDLLAAVTGPRNDDIERFASAHPRLDDYAAFRAACERRGSGWEGWPAPERHGSLPPDGGDPAAFRYHRYAQFLAEEQISSLSARAKRAGAGLYFDASLGVSRAGYDVWRDRDVFALGASTGAPPDAFFAGGQDWGSPPLHPEGVRRQGYRYLIEAMRHAVRHADVVRIDHVMWLHRLFWIPRGFGAREGVYVRYPTDELYGILTLEAARSGTIVVGEDLGTVPAAVRTSMARHGLLRSFVLELDPEDARPPRRSVASLNTHDLPPFAAYWRGRDARRALEKSLHRLAESPSRLVLVNLEDLWLDPRPQNVPGTSEETNPNWRRRARHGFEELRAMPEVVDVLRMIHRARR